VGRAVDTSSGNHFERDDVQEGKSRGGRLHLDISFLRLFRGLVERVYLTSARRKVEGEKNRGLHASCASKGYVFKRKLFLLSLKRMVNLSKKRTSTSKCAPCAERAVRKGM